VTLLPPEQWFATLPTFLATTNAVITDGGGAVLLVKPNYRPYWTLPGGVLDGDEAPHQGCAREVLEELGLAIPVGRLLVVDWSAPTDIRKAFFGFVFDGGTLADPGTIRLQAEELDEYAFTAPDRVGDLLPPHIAGRVAAALAARATGGVAYLYEGVPVSPV